MAGKNSDASKPPMRGGEQKRARKIAVPKPGRKVESSGGAAETLSGQFSFSDLQKRAEADAFDTSQVQVADFGGDDDLPVIDFGGASVDEDLPPITMDGIDEAEAFEPLDASEAFEPVEAEAFEPLDASEAFEPMEAEAFEPIDAADDDLPTINFGGEVDEDDEIAITDEESFGPSAADSIPEIDFGDDSDVDDGDAAIDFGFDAGDSIPAIDFGSAGKSNNEVLPQIKFEADDYKDGGLASRSGAKMPAVKKTKSNSPFDSAAMDFSVSAKADDDDIPMIDFGDGPPAKKGAAATLISAPDDDVPMIDFGGGPPAGVGSGSHSAATLIPGGGDDDVPMVDFGAPAQTSGVPQMIDGGGADDQDSESRLGRLAIESGYVTEDQVMEALDIQSGFAKKGKKMRLGAILTMKGYLSLEQVKKLLEVQQTGIINCPTCSAKYNVAQYPSGHKFNCARCHTLLAAPVRKMAGDSGVLGSSSGSMPTVMAGGSGGASDSASVTLLFDGAGQGSSGMSNTAATMMYDTAGATKGSNRAMPAEMANRPQGSSSIIAAAKPKADNMLGEYEIVRELGRGAMGVVYEGIQKGLGRRCAVKILPANFSTNKSIIERFKREAASVAKLNHPHIIPVYGLGEQDGTHYFAMEFVDGKSLEDIIFKKRLSVEQALKYFKQALDALGYAHKRKVIHRDIKPANLMITNDSDELKVADFGLAREEDSVTITRSGQIMGTPAYMAPEQAMGSKGVVDLRADQYSVGATFYEVFSGHRAFPGDDIHQVIRDVIEKEPVPILKLNPKLPKDVATIIEKCIEKDKEKRYENCEAALADIEAYLKGEPISARPISWVERKWRFMKKHAAITIVSMAAMIIMSLTGVYLYLNNQKAIEEQWSNYREKISTANTGFEHASWDMAKTGYTQALQIAETNQRSDWESWTSAVEEARVGVSRAEDKIREEQLLEKQRIEQEAAERAIIDALENARIKFEAAQAELQAAENKFREKAASLSVKLIEQLREQLDKARSTFGEAIGACPNNDDGSIARNFYSRESHKVGDLLLELRNAQEDIIQIEKSEAATSEGEAALKEAEALLAAGNESACRDKLREAIEAFRRAMAEYPQGRSSDERYVTAANGMYGASMKYFDLALAQNQFDLALFVLAYARESKIDPDACDAKYTELDDQRYELGEYTTNLQRGKEAMFPPPGIAPNYESARNYFQTALDNARRDNTEALNGLRMAEIKLVFKQGDEVFEKKEYQNAIDVYNTVRDMPGATEADSQDVDAKIENVEKAWFAELKIKIEDAMRIRQYGDVVEHSLVALALSAIEERELAVIRGKLNEARWRIDQPRGYSFVSAGEFEVGSVATSDNNPRRIVTISPLYMSNYEVTNEAYLEFIREGGYTQDQWWDQEAIEFRDYFVDGTPGDTPFFGPTTFLNGNFREGTRRAAVGGVSWFEARAYVRWLAQKDGASFRLPNETEWEVACGYSARESSMRDYSWGNASQWQATIGNFGENIAEIGRFQGDLSAYGCYDMAGNVSEWAVSKTGDKDDIVLRGGSFGFNPDTAKEISRRARRVVPPDRFFRSPKTGFRLVISIVTEEAAADGSVQNPGG
ncbi:MAG: protein kinase [Planctomycetes bacterium]|nr:protein kinase [Planctomycetota bacterium]